MESSKEQQRSCQRTGSFFGHLARSADSFSVSESCKGKLSHNRERSSFEAWEGPAVVEQETEWEWDP